MKKMEIVYTSYLDYSIKEWVEISTGKTLKKEIIENGQIGASEIMNNVDCIHIPTKYLAGKRDIAQYNDKQNKGVTNEKI